MGSTNRSLDAVDEQAGLHKYSHVSNNACKMQDVYAMQNIMGALVLGRTGWTI